MIEAKNRFYLVSVELKTQIVYFTIELIEFELLIGGLFLSYLFLK